MENIIEVSHLTKSYNFVKGVFDITFNVSKGEVLGFLGPNGAGKSTCMRHLMGFSIPDSGYARINGFDCAHEYFNTKKEIGYLPGEPTLPKGLNGDDFIKMMSGLKGVYNKERIDYLIKTFEVDTKQDIKRMSIGERRKMAIVTAFMTDADVLLLDEPTSGLDPRMQEIFINFILEEKKRGKTILLSSHIFSEVEKLCDRIIIIKDGHIVSEVSKDDIELSLQKTFKLYFNNAASYEKFILNNEYKSAVKKEMSVSVMINNKDLNKFIDNISNYNIKRFEEITVTLEDYFMGFYKKDVN